MFGFIQNIKHWFDQFLSHGYIQLFQSLYGSAQFPFWFAIQSVWSCYVVHRSTVYHRRSISLGVKKLLLAALMTFASREICAILIQRPSPVFTRPISLGIFAGTFAVVSFCPGDLVYKILTIFYPAIGPTQAFNVFRYYRRMIQALPVSPGHKLSVALALAGADQLFAIVLLPIFKFSGTTIASFASLCFTLTACFAHFLLTNRNRFTPWIGLRNERLTSIILASVLGLLNTALPISVPAAPVPPPPPSPEGDVEGDNSNLRDFEGGWDALTATVKRHKGLVVIHIGAAWSGAAAELSAALPSVAAQFSSVLFLKVDTGKKVNHDVVRRLDVSVLPHVEFVKYQQQGIAQLRTQKGCDAQLLHGALTKLTD
jgi:hypothetical protein